MNDLLSLLSLPQGSTFSLSLKQVPLSQAPCLFSMEDLAKNTLLRLRLTTAISPAGPLKMVAFIFCEKIFTYKNRKATCQISLGRPDSDWGVIL